MKKLFKKIEPHFIGLWKYQAYGGRTNSKNYTYCITLCVKGHHVDTHVHNKVEAAFEEAIKIIGEIKKK